MRQGSCLGKKRAEAGEGSGTTGVPKSILSLPLPHSTGLDNMSNVLHPVEEGKEMRKTAVLFCLAFAGYLVGFNSDAVSRPAWGSDMVYAHGLAMAVKVDGKVLREVNGDAFLPFGSEYSVTLKNLSGRRAVVHVDIDGQRMTDGGLVIDPGASMDLERAIGGNLLEGRKFKFIEKTEEIEKHRGNRVDDGLVRVTYQFERPSPPVVRWETLPYQHQWSGGFTYTNSIGTASIGAAYSSSAVNCSAKSADGITVEGAKSDQRFNYITVGSLEDETHSVVVRLRGKSGDERLASAVTVKAKKTCSSCGRSWPYTQEYCGKDGAYLR